MAQTASEELPYREIGEYPEDYRAGNVVARMVDGLGYRYYWATEGLRPVDLDYKIDETSRSAWFTLEHIYGLSLSVANAVAEAPRQRESTKELDFSALRRLTLENLQVASEGYRGRDAEKMGQLTLRPGSDIPFWHILNGQLSDAIYHVGQIVSYRRASGNPLDPKVNVFMGKNND
ncbi:MAG: hypothetical protein AAGA85_01420 [Bacteroidota bacterium]